MTIENQRKLIDFLKDRYSQGVYFPHEIVTAIAALVKGKQMDIPVAKESLNQIFDGDKEVLTEGLAAARVYTNSRTIDKVLSSF